MLLKEPDSKQLYEPADSPASNFAQILALLANWKRTPGKSFRETESHKLASYAMAMNARIQETLLAVDRLIAKFPLTIGEDGLLLSFLFHSLYKSGDEVRSGLVDPQQGITVEMFRRFIEHFQKSGYAFVSSADVTRGLRAGGKYILITFDDGYYNNVRALPVLEEFQVPATLFVSTGHVKEGKAFWWDVVERKTRKRSVPPAEGRDLLANLKRLRTVDAETQLIKLFGPNSMRPVSDLDRPFTPAELRDFAQHPLISLGNHTRDHAILPNYSMAEALKQIQCGQDDLQSMTGKSADMIAYPNGDESPAIREVAKNAGIHFGVGVHPGRNRLPLQPDSREAMGLRRFTLTGDAAIESQCRMSRSGFSLYRSARSMKLRAGASFSSLRPA
jgi:peptidoglycan/xylan/chitin deacetylase (PgdA/CDA1 family)